MGAHVSVPMYWRALDQRLGLEGRRCRACGSLQFPPQGLCARCGAPELEPFRFCGRGRLYAWTRLTPAGAPPEFAEQAAREGGYYVALIDLQEGVRITAQLVDLLEPTQEGMALEMVVRRLYTEEGVVRYGFKFRPAAADRQEG